MAFKVENADFIADKLAAELLPNQEYREVLINSIEAIQRLQKLDPDYRGTIEFDVDWPLLAATRAEGTPTYCVSCADNGDGMSKRELEVYTSTLAVVGANGNQAVSGNQGMGLKISGPTRHPHGVVIRTLRDGDAWMVQIGKVDDEYDFLDLDEDGTKIGRIDPSALPEFIRDAGHGTIVTFRGVSANDETYDQTPKNWLFKYCNTRLFETPENIEIKVRQPAGAKEDWPTDRHEASKLQSWNMAKVRGTGGFWSRAAQHSGVVDIPQNLDIGAPPARMHWYVFSEDGDLTSRTYAGGAIGVLYQNEVHDWRWGGSASPAYARCGILYGKSRVGLIIEPLGPTVHSDFARAHVLVGGTQLTDHEAFEYYTHYFRDNRPAEIDALMKEERDRIAEEDPERAKRINNRIKDILAIMRPRRFRQDPGGDELASGEVSGAGTSTSTPASSSGAGGGKRGGAGRGLGSLLATADAAGEDAREVRSTIPIEAEWYSEAKSDDLTLVEANGRGLRDRAAGLIGENAATAAKVAINKDFRGFVALVDEANKYANPEGDETKTTKIEDICREWVEQKIVEAILSVRQLEDSKGWMDGHLNQALSPLGLTTAFMADRFHTWQEVKRATGKMR